MQTHVTYERDLTFHKLYMALGAFLLWAGLMCGTLSHVAHVRVHGPTRQAHICTRGPGLVGHNVLHVAGHHRTEKSPHDIMVNINIVFHSFIT